MTAATALLLARAHLAATSEGPVVERDVMVPMRDGVRLATDLYFPAPDGRRGREPLPVILTRTPYDKRNHALIGERCAAQGYVFAAQDVRGRYRSEGGFYPFAHEAPDGYDAVEWLAAQPWCNGKVGTMGQSYEAAVQSALACLRPPHLAAMVITYGPASFFHSSMRHNGVLELRFFVYAFLMASTSKEAQADPTIKAALDAAYADIWAWVEAGPIHRGSSPLRLVPACEQWLLDVLTRVTYDDYWRQPGYGPRPWYDQHADVPTLYVGGWYDTYPRSTVENFVALSGRQRQPVYMLMGPWHHGGAGQPQAGDLSFEPEGGLPDYLGMRLGWFDHFLKGMPGGLEQSRPVRYFVMGGGPGLQAGSRVIRHGGRWCEADAWPPQGCTPTPFYLHADGGLRTDPPHDEPAPTTWTFDPSRPVPTIGGNLSAIPIPAGGFDQRNDERFPFSHGRLPLSARQDVLCFATEPLVADLEIAGPVRVRLWVSTDAPDTDFTAKLIDVYPPAPGHPDGCALNLTDSIARLRFRNGYEREELATPGEVYELQFELYPTANRFVAGHRIRVDISSSNYPRFELNPNTGGPLGADRRRRVAENSLHHSASRPSQIILPVMAR
ncbi:MAG: CocE/NonD family hydrolase [Armatimonadota bacterium]